MKPPVKARKFSEEVRVENDIAFRSMVLTDPHRFDVPLARIKNGRGMYEKVSDRTDGVPWWFVGCVHMMEADFDFTAHLHNGDPLAHRTVNEPAGRPVGGNGPFTWLESAEDALTMPGKRLNQVTDWSLPHALWLLEAFNGFGYRLYQKMYTPYLWAGTSLYKAGKYVADGQFSARAVSKQPGCAGLLKVMQATGLVTFSNIGGAVK